MQELRSKEFNSYMDLEIFFSSKHGPTLTLNQCSMFQHWHQAFNHAVQPTHYMKLHATNRRNGRLPFDIWTVESALRFGGDICALRTNVMCIPSIYVVVICDLLLHRSQCTAVQSRFGVDVNSGGPYLITAVKARRVQNPSHISKTARRLLMMLLLELGYATMQTLTQFPSDFQHFHFRLASNFRSIWTSNWHQISDPVEPHHHMASRKVDARQITSQTKINDYHLVNPANINRE